MTVLSGTPLRVRGNDNNYTWKNTPVGNVLIDVVAGAIVGLPMTLTICPFCSLSSPNIIR